MAVNMREKYESLSLAVLRDIAKNRGIKSTSTMRKEAVIDAMLAEDEKAAAAERMKTQATETGKTVTDMVCWMQRKREMRLHWNPSISPAITLAGLLRRSPWFWIHRHS